MFLSSSSLPYSFYSLLIDDMSVVTDKYSHRPDNLVSDVYGVDFFVESLCNEASNVSALSLEPGSAYLLPSELFLKYFLGV